MVLAYTFLKLYISKIWNGFSFYIYIYIYKGGRGHGVGSGSTVIQLYNFKIMQVKWMQVKAKL